MKLPTQTSELGLYYHYKHDPLGPIENYAYELIGVGINTEDNCGESNENMVIYRALYKSSINEKKNLFWLRPLSMWNETVNKEGKTFLRFTKITDASVKEHLGKIRDKMYGAV